MKWIEVSITIKRVVMDDVATLFSDYESNGFIEEDIDNEPDKVRVTIYADDSKSALVWQGNIIALLVSAGIEFEAIRSREVNDNTWLHSWQQYIMPTEILPGLIIRPIWQSYTPKLGDTVMMIDSKLSFGTGDHETTRDCALLMNKYGENKEFCLDIGTGTGILLLVAHYLGIHHLYGIDIDEEAAKQARDNCLLNEVPATVIYGDLADDFDGKADLVVANLTVDPLKMLLPMIGQKLSKNGILIISGIIDERYDEIMPYIVENWTIVEEKVTGPWHTFALEAKA